MNGKKMLIPFLLAAAALLIMGLLITHHVSHCEKCLSFDGFRPEMVKHMIESFGPLAIVVYILLYALNTVSLLPPIGIMSLTAGFVFGAFKGTIALTLGAFLGTTCTFFISRVFGARFVDRFLKGKHARDFQDKLNRNGFLVILFIRLIPVLPWEVVNYVSGLSRIRYRDYILGTMIGIFPSILVQTYFADRVASFNLRDPGLIIAVAAFLLLGAVPAVYLKFRKKTGGEAVHEKT